MPITISEISKDSYTDIHGRREYEQRYIALSGETVVGAADTIEALLEDVAHCCREAAIETPQEVVVWDQGSETHGETA